MPRSPSPAAERVAAVAAALAVLVAAAPAGVQVRVADGRVDVEATAAPVSDVLDALAARTGMQVEYEGSPPRQLVSLALHDRTPVEAVLGVLDGQRIDYALQLDSAGTGVRLLLVTSTSGPTSRRPRPPLPPEPAYEEPPQPFEQTFGEPAEGATPDEEQPDQPSPAAPPGALGGPVRPGPGPLLFPSPLTLPSPTPQQR